MIPSVNEDLQPRNTLAVPSRAELFYCARSVAELQDIIRECQSQARRLLVLGEGSNVVLPERITGVVVQPRIAGRQVISRTATNVRLRVGAGENWHELVEWSLDQGFFGLENLALIPGTVGAAPVQNIGAYGAEISRFLKRVEAVTIASGEVRSLTNAECEFGYRDSVFKQRLRQKSIITHVDLELDLVPRVNLDYPALRQNLRATGSPQPVDVFAAVCALRRERLPDPALLPNCGSFFKNPVVDDDFLQTLRQRYPDIVAFPVQADSTSIQSKLAAAWLIDQAGWKGKSLHGVAVHHRQALVLVNPDRRPAEQVLALAGAIQDDIEQQFGVRLEMEPERLGWA